MISAVALESRRAQASASLMITSAMVLVLMTCANGSAFSSRGGTALCFFLAGRFHRKRVWMVLGKGGSMGLMYLHLLLPTHFDFCFFAQFEGAAPSGSPSILLIWTGLSLWGLPALACLCRSPGGV